MNVKQDKLQQIIREELKEVLGMDAKYNAIKEIMSVLEDYTHGVPEDALEILNAVAVELQSEEK